MDLGELASVEVDFQRTLMASRKFHEALMLVCQNSKGRTWLIGGAVFRTLANIMYGTPVPPETDFDFIVDELEKKIVFREDEGWRLEENHYKNPKLIKGDLSVDLIPLAKVHSIVRRGVEPTIENFLSGTPLNIQSLAYDCVSRRLMGRIGLGAICHKVVAVNNIDQCVIQASRKNLTIPELIRKYADELGFEAELPT